MGHVHILAVVYNNKTALLTDSTCCLLTGVQFKVVRPPNYMMNIVLLLSIALIGGLVYLKRDSLDFLFQKSTWACIVISFILVMMSGQMWNQIRGPGFAHRDPRTGEVVRDVYQLVYLYTHWLCYMSRNYRLTID